MSGYCSRCGKLIGGDAQALCHDCLVQTNSIPHGTIQMTLGRGWMLTYDDDYYKIKLSNDRGESILIPPITLDAIVKYWPEFKPKV